MVVLSSAVVCVLWSGLVVPLQVEIFHQQHAETRGTVLSRDSCHRLQQATQAHQFVLSSLKETMAQTLRMSASTVTMKDIEDRVARELLRRTHAPDDHDEGEQGGGGDDDDDQQGGGGAAPQPKRLRGSSSGVRRLQLGGTASRQGRGGGAPPRRTSSGLQGGPRSRTPRNVQADSPRGRGGGRGSPGSRSRTRNPVDPSARGSSPGAANEELQLVAVGNDDAASVHSVPNQVRAPRSPGKVRQTNEERAASYRIDVLAAASDVLSGTLSVLGRGGCKCKYTLVSSVDRYVCEVFLVVCLADERCVCGCGWGHIPFASLNLKAMVSRPSATGSSRSRGSSSSWRTAKLPRRHRSSARRPSQ